MMKERLRQIATVIMAILMIFCVIPVYAQEQDIPEDIVWPEDHAAAIEEVPVNVDNEEIPAEEESAGSGEDGAGSEEVTTDIEENLPEQTEDLSVPEADTVEPEEPAGPEELAEPEEPAVQNEDPFVSEEDPCKPSEDSESASPCEETGLTAQEDLCTDPTQGDETAVADPEETELFTEEETVEITDSVVPSEEYPELSPETEVIEEEEDPEDPPVSDPTSGNCGENAFWTLTEGGVLLISGSGEITDYDPAGNPVPWATYQDSIINVVIDEGITGIGVHAFSSCFSLTAISIPASVTTIGTAAFEGAVSLENVYYGGTITQWAEIWILAGNISLTDAGIHCADGDFLTGWQEIDGNRYYYKGGTPATGWVKVEGIWYYMDSQGVMQTGWMKISGKWYHFDPSTGAVQTGWVIDDGKYYYFNKKTGVIQTGWVKDNDQYYYFDKKTGVIHLGWLKYGDDYYYFSKKNGALQTGWVTDSGKYYYFDPADGTLQIGWVDDNGARYYLDPDTGTPHIGWLKWDSNWYYFLENGTMATGCHWIDGKIAMFENNGIYKPVYYLGDSIGVSIKDTLKNYFYTLYADCRNGRAISTKPYGVQTGITAAFNMKQYVEGGYLILELGSNEAGTSYEEIVSEIESIRSIVGFNTRIMLVTCYIHKDNEVQTMESFGHINRYYRELAEADPYIACADWAGIASPLCVADTEADPYGLHLTDLGKSVYISMLTNTWVNGF